MSSYEDRGCGPLGEDLKNKIANGELIHIASWMQRQAYQFVDESNRCLNATSGRIRDAFKVFEEKVTEYHVAKNRYDVICTGHNEAFDKYVHEKNEANFIIYNETTKEKEDCGLAFKRAVEGRVKAGEVHQKLLDLSVRIHKWRKIYIDAVDKNREEHERAAKNAKAELGQKRRLFKQAGLTINDGGSFTGKGIVCDFRAINGKRIRVEGCNVNVRITGDTKVSKVAKNASFYTDSAPSF